MGEGDATYTVRLATRPGSANNVTVTITRAAGSSTDVTFDTGDGAFAASGETLTFRRQRRRQRRRGRLERPPDGDRPGGGGLGYARG